MIYVLCSQDYDGVTIPVEGPKGVDVARLYGEEYRDHYFTEILGRLTPPDYRYTCFLTKVEYLKLEGLGVPLLKLRNCTETRYGVITSGAKYYQLFVQWLVKEEGFAAVDYVEVGVWY